MTGGRAANPPIWRFRTELGDLGLSPNIVAAAAKFCNLLPNVRLQKFLVSQPVSPQRIEEKVVITRTALLARQL